MPLRDQQVFVNENSIKNSFINDCVNKIDDRSSLFCVRHRYIPTILALKNGTQQF